MKNQPLWVMAALVLATSTEAYGNRSADVLVIGSQENEVQLTGSGQYISRERISTEGTADIMRVLRKEVPGLTSYGEDGYGLFPNISFRGGSSERSRKVAIMEDGILQAPAPYSAPAAYYSPYVGRMSGVEVLKGSSQVLYGPMTTGGVINYLSTPLRNSSETHYRVFTGSNRELQTQINHGDRVGNFSYVLELATRSVEGFNTIDPLASVPFDNEDTGHSLYEPMIKLAYDLEHGRWFHRFEVKAGRTDLVANESYVGLSDDDFERDPHRRYSGTRFDQIRTNQKRTYFRHLLSWSDQSELRTTLYYNKFARNWYKLHDLPGTGGLDLSDSAVVDVLRGEAAGNLRVRANNRSFESRGVQQDLDQQINNHRIRFGWRFHRDYERRFQWQDVYAQAAGGEITSITRGVPGEQDNRKASAEAFSAYLQDEITLGRLSLIPGVRFETVTFKTDNYNDPSTDELKGSLSVVNPGIGARYAVSDRTVVFGGVYQGSALPGAGSVTREIDPIKKAETSLTTEIGIRTRPHRAARLESTLFYTSIKNILALESIASGATETTAVGRAKSYGLEFKGVYDVGEAMNSSWSNPWYLTGTYNKATIDGNFTGTGGYLDGEKGNYLPYSPEITFTVGTGLGYGRFSFDINGSFNGKMYKTAENLDSEKIKSFLVFDSSLSYQLTEQAQLVVSALNLFDNDHMISRTPYGARAGRPQTYLVGLQGQF